MISVFPEPLRQDLGDNLLLSAGVLPFKFAIHCGQQQTGWDSAWNSDAEGDESPILPSLRRVCFSQRFDRSLGFGNRRWFAQYGGVGRLLFLRPVPILKGLACVAEVNRLQRRVHFSSIHDQMPPQIENSIHWLRLLPGCRAARRRYLGSLHRRTPVLGADRLRTGCPGS
jgi:hypothetical protein